ncbi:hypothetical protein NEHOM01_0171 [Nematocida homosporus]|uniref:uncharacterized protein n=1 Tax=Nematocida homosporus TaxID=1912981 RepID=UPI00221F07BE|nr:uncharacterized protein NEHOM01_0171 [Nematocida homosporus]KAI5184426.1 hypothetical protein NEHOM01_0171 [Nematocida homosporus]
MPEKSREQLDFHDLADSSSSSTSSNDTLELLASRKENDANDAFKIVKGANRALGGALRTSHKTTKSLAKQDEVLTDTLKRKKGIRKTIETNEERVVQIGRSGHLVSFGNRFFDAIGDFFTGRRRAISAVDKAATDEEEKAQKDERLAADDGVDEKAAAEALEASGEEGDVDAELEKTLIGLKTLRKGVKSQTKRIRAQTHATKEMVIMDKDTNKRTKSLTKKIKKLG